MTGRLAGALALAALLAGCASARPQGTASTGPAAAPAPPAAADNPPLQFQFLYGSAEAAALSRQAFLLVTLKAISRTGAEFMDSVVLASDATLAAPRFLPCGTKPHAVIFDADETVILNLGIEALAARDPSRPFDEAQWERWERTGAAAVAPVPGAVEAFAALRSAGVTPIVNSNRTLANAQGTIAALRQAGLGDFVLNETLFLRDGPSAKDARRARIAERWCVVAMAGDQLGDFSDLFGQIPSPAERRRAADRAPVARLWGDGWFVLPNPVYGSALRGNFDEVFPADRRWTDPGQGGND